MRNNLDIGAIILAGGRGERFHQPKQYCVLENKPIWKHVYDKMIQVVDKNNVVVVGVDIEGGDTRTESVIKGLNSINRDTSRLIIAEAARPLVTLKQLEILAYDKHPSSTFVTPLVNTVIMRDGSYLNRNEMYQLLTPQAFDYKLLLKAYASGRYKGMTDETRVMFEFYNIKPHMIETTDNLIKITYPKDLAVVEKIMEMESRNEKEKGANNRR